MTPEEARLIAENYLHAGMHGAAETVRSLADQVEALQKDAERYRWLMADDGNASITGRFNSVYRAWNGEGGADGLTAAIDRAREAT